MDGMRAMERALDAYGFTHVSGHPDKIVPSLQDFPVAENHVTYTPSRGRGVLAL